MILPPRQANTSVSWHRCASRMAMMNVPTINVEIGNTGSRARVSHDARPSKSNTSAHREVSLCTKSNTLVFGPVQSCGSSAFKANDPPPPTVFFPRPDHMILPLKGKSCHLTPGTQLPPQAWVSFLRLKPSIRHSPRVRVRFLSSTLTNLQALNACI